MKIKKVIEKIEGEATLDLEFSDGKVSQAKILFENSRGIENILVGKAPRDALVITPRVCGICNHAHLQASVRALEDGYKRSGIEFELTKKAKNIRDFTLSCELIQNHIKWLYLTIIPSINKILGLKTKDSTTLKALYATQFINKASSIFAGQWPHSSYCVPGGVTCDPTFVDITQAQSYLEEVIKFFETVVAGVDIDTFLNYSTTLELKNLRGDLSDLLYKLGTNGYDKKGKSSDRFIVFGNSCGFKEGKSISTKYSKVDVKYTKEHLQNNSVAKAVVYRCKFYETGPLARAVVAKEPLIMSLRKKYRDSLLVRVFARVFEIAKMLKLSKELLKEIDISEASCVLDSKLLSSNFKGIGIVEAARGSLIHKIDVQEGKIKSYDIITPTQWNLSNAFDDELGIAQKAIIGSQSEEEAELILRSFDVCSVCTVQ